MNTNEMESYSLWRPNSFEVFQEARRQGVRIKLGCHMRMGGVTADVLLKGRFLEVTGSVALFEIKMRETLPGKSKPVDPACEFSFSLDQDAPSGATEKMGYSGRASILENRTDEDGLPQRMLLRLSRQYVTRRLRRDKRLDWNAENTGLLGLLVIADLPANRQDLSARLKDYYKLHGEKKPGLINISAGGACLCVEEDLARRPLMAHELYLFLLAPKAAGQGELPYIFTGKKVGLSRDACEQGTALRMRFLYELDWAKSPSALHWADVESSGSGRLRHLIRDLSDIAAPAQEKAVGL